MRSCHLEKKTKHFFLPFVFLFSFGSDRNSSIGTEISQSRCAGHAIIDLCTTRRRKQQQPNRGRPIRAVCAIVIISTRVASCWEIHSPRGYFRRRRKKGEEKIGTRHLHAVSIYIFSFFFLLKMGGVPRLVYREKLFITDRCFK